VLLVTFSTQGLSGLHLVTSSIMSIPGALLLSKLLIPEEKKPVTLGAKVTVAKSTDNNVLEALANGATDGFRIAGIILAMLIVFVSLIALINNSLAQGIFWITGYEGITLDFLLGKMFSGIPYLLDIDPAERVQAASLIGQRVVVNEFFAYVNMLKMSLSQRTLDLMTYALCGFANISSIGIQLGGIGAMAPNKRSEIIDLGWTALFGATLVNLLNTFIASLFI
jgi:CNT family concentrative nucleoside transporter